MATPPQFTAGAILTAAQMNAVGLWEVSSGTLSLTTSPTQVTGVFLNADFPHYKLIVKTTATSTSNKILFKFIAGTTPASTAYYGGGVGGSAGSNTTVYFERSSNATSLSLGAPTSAATRVTAFDIIGPNSATQTMYGGFYTEVNNADAFHWGGTHLTAAAYDGFEMATSAGTQTVEYNLYGYRA
jgi:hypothetical protein